MVGRFVRGTGVCRWDEVIGRFRVDNTKCWFFFIRWFTIKDGVTILHLYRSITISSSNVGSEMYSFLFVIVFEARGQKFTLNR